MNKKNNNVGGNSYTAAHLARVTLNLWTTSDENTSHKDAIYVLLKSLIGEKYEGVTVFDMDVIINEEYKNN